MKSWLAVGAAFGLLIIAYSLAFVGGGWHPTDYEYVPSQTWRLLHGEVPYRDFIYHKPPGTLLVHWIWLVLPDAIAVRASRVFVYLQMAAATAVPILWAVHRRVVPFGWRLPLLGVATTAIALHNFPIMPWQTTDGVFFVSLGGVCFLESLVATARPLRWRALASALFAVALLCKQSFILNCAGLALFAAGELLWTLARQPDRKRAAVARLGASAVPALVLLGAVFAWLVASGAWPHYVAQFQSQSSGGALWWHLSELYRDSSFAWLFGLWMVVPFVRVLDGPGLNRWVVRALGLIPFLGIVRDARRVEGMIPWDIAHELGVPVATAMAGLAVGEAILWLLLRTVAKDHPARATSHGLLLLLAGGALLTALACQLSLGYNSAILGLGLFGLLLHGALPRESSWVEVAGVAAIAFFILQPMWRSNQRTPYRDAPRKAMTRDLGDLFPKLRGIRTWPGNHARYEALKRIVTDEILPTGRPFVSLQDYPGLNWLFDRRNPISIDWCYPPEPDGFEPTILAELERSGAVVVMPKSKDANWAAPPPRPVSCSKLDARSYNLISRYVVATWQLAGENAYFCLYRSRASR